jgi:hypothetical protein
LEALLQRLLIIFLRSVFHDYGVVPFTDFAALLGLPLPSSGISASRGGDAGSETNFTTSSCKKHIG